MQWQAEQLARDAAAQKQKEKDEKARARRAKSARRKLAKAKAELEKLGEISDWEDEFAASVDERLEKYGSAFSDREKGAPSDALSRLQKQVLSQMRRKAKDKSKQSPDGPKPSGFKPRSSFKNKSGFKPRVRQLDEDLEDEPGAQPPPKTGKPAFKLIKGGKSE